MIHDDTARRMAIKFFREQKLERLTDVAKGKLTCVEALFRKALEDLGKAKVRELYFKLPEQLRRFFLFSVTHPELTGKLKDIDDKYECLRLSKRPERVKGYQGYIGKVQKVVLKFLTS